MVYVADPVQTSDIENEGEAVDRYHSVNCDENNRPNHESGIPVIPKVRNGGNAEEDENRDVHNAREQLHNVVQRRDRVRIHVLLHKPTHKEAGKDDGQNGGELNPLRRQIGQISAGVDQKRLDDWCVASVFRHKRA